MALALCFELKVFLKFIFHYYINKLPLRDRESLREGSHCELLTVFSSLLRLNVYRRMLIVKIRRSRKDVKWQVGNVKLSIRQEINDGE